MEFEMEGNGKPCILLHGFLESPQMWEPLKKHLNDHCAFVNVLLPGHGGELCWNEGKSIKSVAKDIFNSLNHLEPEWIIGHSLGGYVGLELMLLFPNAKLILLNSIYWQDGPDKKMERKRVAKIVRKNLSLFLNEAIPNLFREEKRAEMKLVIENLINNASKLDPLQVSNTIDAMRKRRDFTNLLESNNAKQRLFMISGDKDPLLKNGVVDEKIVHFLPHERNIILKNSGHMSIMEDEALTITTLKELINSHCH